MSLKNNPQRKAGIALAYVSILISSVIGIAFTPYMVSKLGEIEYGLYQTLYATIGYMSLLDFGLGGTLTRFILKFQTDNDCEKVNSVISMCVKLYCFFGVVAMLIVGVLALNLESLFDRNITVENVCYARKLIILMGVSTSLSFISHALSGIQNAYEKHLVIKGVYITRQLLRVVIIAILLQFKFGALAVVTADLAVTVALLLFDIFYCKCRLGIKLLNGKWDFSLLRSLFSYSAFVFLQILVTQTNNNLDRVLLGIFSSFEVVALYGVSMQLHSLFNSVGGVISGITLPKISKVVFADSSREEITDQCSKYSRVQLYISILLLGGVILFGRDFAALWIPGYDNDAIWLLTLLIVTPQLLESVEGTVFNVMKAKNMQAIRSLILFGVMVANVILTIALIQVSPIYGPAIGTCVSFIIGNNILSNIYYHKKVGVDMIRYFKNIFKGILPAWLVSMMVGCVIILIPLCGWLGFIIKGCLYVATYGICVLAFALNDYERQLVNSVIKKLTRR